MNFGEYMKEYEKVKSEKGEDAAGVHIMRMMLDEVLTCVRLVQTHSFDSVDEVSVREFTDAVKYFIDTVDRIRRDWSRFALDSKGRFQPDAFDKILDKTTPGLLDIHKKYHEERKKLELRATLERRRDGKERF